MFTKKRYLLVYAYLRFKPRFDRSLISFSAVGVIFKPLKPNRPVTRCITHYAETVKNRINDQINMTNAPEETVECNYSWNRNNIFRDTQCNPINRRWCIAANARLASKRFDGAARLNAKVKMLEFVFSLSVASCIMCCLQTTTVTTGPRLFVKKKKNLVVLFATIISQSYTRRGDTEPSINRVFFFFVVFNKQKVIQDKQVNLFP